MKSKLTVLATIFSVLPLAALACMVPPGGLTVHHTELVERTDTIVWAKAVGGSGKKAKIWRDPYELMLFETIEVLKGRVPARFTLPNGFDLAGADESDGFPGVSEETDFNGHRDLSFWDKSIARQWNSADCQMYPTFSEGSSYLLFLGDAHWRGYEQVETEEDLWLTAVRNLIAQPSRRSGLSLSIEEWLRLSSSTFIGEIERCDRPELAVRERLYGDVPATWRYSDYDDAYHWPVKNCVVGQKYLVVSYRNDMRFSVVYRSLMVETDGERVDFEAALERSQIYFNGPKVKRIRQLREALRKVQ